LPFPLFGAIIEENLFGGILKMIAGFSLLLVAGLCQGSFGLGYKKYSPFSWAAFWGIYNIMCIITSSLFTFLFEPKIFNSFLSNGLSPLYLPLFCGALWGLSAIGFSKGIDKIGMSMVYGISMGISTIVGSVMPMVINKTTPSPMFFLSLILTLSGVAVITIAGVRRDGKMGGSLFGIVLSVLSGLGSGAMNVGFTDLQGFGEELSKLGCSDFSVSAAKWLPVLIGGCTMGLIWCICETSFTHRWETVTAKGSARRAFILFLVSIVWYAALLLYGIAIAHLGSGASSAGWILFNALALMISVFWGLKTGEWKGKSKKLLFSGCIVLVVAWICTALS
jgi:L-rhamnose-H+ transport protein